MLDTKYRQTRGHPEVWIVVVDRVGLVDADDTAAALARRADDIPTNWMRFWFLPATDHTSVLEVRIEGRQLQGLAPLTEP